MKPIKLNIAQVEANSALDLVRRKTNKGVVVLPTGTGKTILSIHDSLKFKGKKLFLVHNIDILNQTINAFKDFYKDLNYGIFSSSRKDKDKEVLFATTQTMTNHLEKFPRDYFEYIIIDEVHHYQAKSYKKVVEYFKPKFLLGLTATPYRTDNKNIYDICGDPIYMMSIGRAMKLGLLCPLNYKYVKNNIDFSNINHNGNKYNERDLNRKICIPKYDEVIFKEWYSQARDRKTIVFCASTLHVERMTRFFNDKGIRACGIHCRGQGYIDENENYVWSTNARKFTPVGQKKTNRTRIVDDFKDDKYQVVCVRDVFNEGVDLPSANCILMLRPTESSIIFTQQIGRGLRAKERKELLVLDFTGNCLKCNINLDVLSQIAGINIKNQLDKYKKSGDILQNDLIIVNNNCKIELTSTNFDVIEKNITKEEIITEYFRLKKLLANCKTQEERDIVLNTKKKDNVVFLDKFYKDKKLEKDLETRNVYPKKPYEGKKTITVSNKGFDETSEEKNKIRKRIIGKIKDGDNVLLLESPGLWAIKEIISQGIKPNLIVIPNHLEYKALQKALMGFKTNLNIKVINTSALQYLKNCDTTFEFMWLDYCGSFKFYKKDLEICLANHSNNNLKLILTYNILDFNKQHEGFNYFVECYNHLIKVDNKQHEVTFMDDVTYKYKRTMYNIGFDLEVRA